MASPFETSREVREQHLKEYQKPVPNPELRPQAAEQLKPDPFGVTAKKRTRKTYTVYLDGDLMEQVKRLAKQREVSASLIIETCIKKTLSEIQ